MNPIILATTSKYKIALFQRLGFPFITASPTCEEIHLPNEVPQEQALRLAREKALSLKEVFPNHLIIGADQVLALGREIFTKPGTVEKAVDQLMRLSGRTHALHTAYTIFDGSSGREKSRLVTARLRMRSRMDRTQLMDLVSLDESHDCVGGYKWECRGIQLFSAIQTRDSNAIIGLPMITLAADLRDLLWE